MLNTLWNILVQSLTHIPLTWKIWRAPNNASRWLMGFNSVFKGLTKCNDINNQQDSTNFSFINLFKSAQHVSGDKFAHSQEHFLTVYTAFSTMYCNDKLELKVF